MACKYFKDYVTEDLNLAEMHVKEIDDNILLEAKIEEEIESKQLRRSKRIMQKRILKDIQEAYEYFLKSIQTWIRSYMD